VDWIYGQIVGFLGNFFALMGNMGVELFELEWVSAIILFFSRLAWALFAVSVVVCAFECGIEYSTGRGNLQQCGMNIIKGFLAVSLFTVVPVRLYALSVSLQGTFSAGLTGYGRSIGEVGQDIITELNEIQTLSDVVNSSHFGLGIITSPIMLLFCVILMGYAVLKVFFANLKRGGILLIQIAVGSLYMFSVPRGYLDGFTAPDLFIKMFADGRPITAQEYNALTALRMENTGKVNGVFELDFDKREFSAVRIMDGWQTWPMRDVSAAVYHATRSQFASSGDKWRKLLDHLSGKEITSAGHLSARNFSFGDEIIESDGKLNFFVQTEFDVDAAFGTFVLTDENDDWLNVYANYDIAQGKPCDTLELTLCKGDGSEENWSYQLNAAEQDVLLRKMEEYCQQQTGMSLHDYAQQFREEPEQQQGPVMKL
jgi:hypothetical protein